MLQFSKPLEKMRQIQPFGVNYLGEGEYKKAGLPNDKHNGWDLSTDGISGKTFYAVADGVCVAEGSPDRGGYGLVARLYVPIDPSTRLEVVYGHLQAVSVTGEVKRGDPLGLCDNSGFSTGPHLHFGVRLQKKDAGGWEVQNYDNGYLGYIDPAQFFPKSTFDLPVEQGYGLSPAKSEVAWYADALYFWQKVKRLPSTIEKKALLYGRWDLRTVLDAAMFPIWSEYSKPEAQKRGIIK